MLIALVCYDSDISFKSRPNPARVAPKLDAAAAEIHDLGSDVVSHSSEKCMDSCGIKKSQALHSQRIDLQVPGQQNFQNEVDLESLLPCVRHSSPVMDATALLQAAELGDCSTRQPSNSLVSSYSE
mmetsp:Transcript_9664/g.17969  ORF Transcript_9664/g.17969 Transcript_9664/m.17969 type:complete len:126 (+) Transcript_9664:1-378(+)